MGSPVPDRDLAEARRDAQDAQTAAYESAQDGLSPRVLSALIDALLDLAPGGQILDALVDEERVARALVAAIRIALHSDPDARAQARAARQARRRARRGG